MNSVQAVEIIGYHRNKKYETIKKKKKKKKSSEGTFIRRAKLKLCRKVENISFFQQFAEAHIVVRGLLVLLSTE